MKTSPAVLVSILIIATAPASAPLSLAATVQGDQAELEGRIDPLFAKWDRADSPGASVAVIRDGKIIYSKGYGSAQIEYEIPVTPSTIFHVASVSKQFTSMAVTLLAYDGKLSLDDDIRIHLPEVPDLGRTVTVRQLMHHTSGIRDQWELLAMAGWRLDDVITTEHVMNMMRHQRELNFEPGAEYMYSNMGYTLLGQIVARVSGMTFPAFTKKRIFDPLGMTSTHMHDDHQMVVKGRAYSYSAAEGGGYTNAVLSYANAGATSLFTTAEDLAHWLDNFGHARVGGREVVEAMQHRFVLNGGDTIAYAQGVSLGEYRGAKTVSHSGGDAGFRSHVVWFPESKTGVVVLSNLGNFNPSGKAFEIADVVLEDVFPEPVAAAAARERVTLDEATLDRFEGRFLLSFGSVMSIEREEGRLLGRMPLAGTVELVPVSDTEFRIEEFGMLMRFHLMEPQAGDSISMHTPNGEEIGNGHRIEKYEVTNGQLAEYEGVYYSPELGTLYRFEVVEGSLVAQHRRHGTIPVTPMSQDEFIGERWFFGNVKFTRGATGHVNGFRVTGGRVRNLRFEKLDWKSW